MSNCAECKLKAAKIRMLQKDLFRLRVENGKPTKTKERKEMMELLNTKYSQSKIARMLGISQGNVWNILNEK